MISKLGFGGCVNEDAKLRMGVDIGRYASEEAEPRRGVDCEIPELRERNIFFYKGVETSPYNVL